MKKSSLSWVVPLVVLLGAAVIGEYWWYRHKQAEQDAQLPPVVQAPMPEPSAPASLPPEPAIRYPIEAAAGASAPAPAELPVSRTETDAYIGKALAGLLGRSAVQSFLQLDDFAPHVVATADNLARPQAAARLWPVKPAPDRFRTTPGSDGTYISTDNASRYSAFVGFIESVDTERAVAVYKRLYPLFQREYEALGYPGKYFNDRLVHVIDHLLQAPEPPQPIKVTLTEVKGELKATRPWVRYEFADPALEARSSGQKILMRMGSANAQRVKAKLRELRRLVTGGEVAR